MTLLMVLMRFLLLTRNVSKLRLLLKKPLLQVHCKYESVGVTAVPIQNDLGFSGITPYSFDSVPLGETIRFTAPARAQNVPFAMWLGCDSVINLTCEVTIRGNVSIRVVYSDQATDIGSILGAPSLQFTSSGDVLWQPDFSKSLSGIASMKSGKISDNQTSSLMTTVQGQGVLRFNWQVSSEQDYDFLSFYINDELMASISGSWCLANTRIQFACRNAPA
ncbi:hypothetical protein [Alishewanella longhuensis]